jgi:chitodextrinase
MLAAHPTFAEYVDPEQEMLDAIIPTLTDEQAELIPAAFRGWAVDTSYSVGDRVRYNDALWRCVQAHTSLAGWEPNVAPALWSRTSPEGEIPDWVRPTGAQDAYGAGDRARHVDRVWQSLVDANVWEPGAAGSEALWSDITGGDAPEPEPASEPGPEPEPEPGPTPDPEPEQNVPEWVQPVGPSDAYGTGDMVAHNGGVWESLVDGNVWEPGAVGTESLWSEVTE